MFDLPITGGIEPHIHAAANVRRRIAPAVLQRPAF